MPAGWAKPCADDPRHACISTMCLQGYRLWSSVNLKLSYLSDACVHSMRGGWKRALDLVSLCPILLPRLWTYYKTGLKIVKTRQYVMTHWASRGYVTVLLLCMQPAVSQRNTRARFASRPNGYRVTQATFPLKLLTQKDPRFKIWPIVTRTPANRQPEQWETQRWSLCGGTLVCKDSHPISTYTRRHAVRGHVAQTKMHAELAFAQLELWEETAEQSWDRLSRGFLPIDVFGEGGSRQSGLGIRRTTASDVWAEFAVQAARNSSTTHTRLTCQYWARENNKTGKITRTKWRKASR